MTLCGELLKTCIGKSKEVGRNMGCRAWGRGATHSPVFPPLSYSFRGKHGESSECTWKYGLTQQKYARKILTQFPPTHTLPSSCLEVQHVTAVKCGRPQKVCSDSSSDVLNSRGHWVSNQNRQSVNIRDLQIIKCFDFSRWLSNYFQSLQIPTSNWLRLLYFLQNYSCMVVPMTIDDH